MAITFTTASKEFTTVQMTAGTALATWLNALTITTVHGMMQTPLTHETVLVTVAYV